MLSHCIGKEVAEHGDFQSAYGVRSFIGCAGAHDEQAAVEGYVCRQSVADATGVAAVQREENVFGFAARFRQPVVQDASGNARALRAIEVGRRECPFISNVYTVAAEIKYEHSFCRHTFGCIYKTPFHAFKRTVR